MKRSVQVAAPLLASVALSVMTGCRQTQPKRCVDDKNQVVDPSFCEVQNQNQNTSTYHPGYWPYHFYYGGSGGYAPGSFASGGSLVPSAGVSYSTTRGGFGSSFGGGDSSGAGHGGSGGE